MSGKISVRELAERKLTVDGDWRRQPVVDERVRVFIAMHRPANDVAPDARQHQYVHEGLPSRRHSGRIEALSKLSPGQRAILRKGSEDRFDPAFG
jgi:hypothetical protein